MTKKISVNTYRSAYIQCLAKGGYDIPKEISDYHVHHIDKNRTNNDFVNLVLLSKTEHAKYHYWDNRINSSFSGNIPTEEFTILAINKRKLEYEQMRITQEKAEMYSKNWWVCFHRMLDIKNEIANASHIHECWLRCSEKMSEITKIVLSHKEYQNKYIL